MFPRVRLSPTITMRMAAEPLAVWDSGPPAQPASTLRAKSAASNILVMCLFLPLLQSLMRVAVTLFCSRCQRTRGEGRFRLHHPGHCSLGQRDEALGEDTGKDDGADEEYPQHLGGQGECHAFARVVHLAVGG